jgi:hypothetical protein
MLKLSKSGGRNTTVKIKRKGIKEVVKFACLENMVEKNGKIKNDIN